MKQTFGMLALSTLGFLVATGCSSNGSGGPGPASGGGAGASSDGGAGAAGSAGQPPVAQVVDCAAQTAAVTVRMVQASEIFAFDPGNATVSVHDVVEFDNASTMDHTSTSGMVVPDPEAGVVGVPDGKWDTGPIAPGTSACVKMLAPGQFKYYCAFHLGMVGTIVVQ